ncbi:latent-transforming growth factor beta-binding protein 4-like isoform X2 [Mya arenaria]|uniref:latent-transforming growth factor beta-binding protein 4-like isoform X2 n=1 Tax=Mya arenaria TaxID=6604 RepID=UPI0022E13FFA|nr:latent-transforming growth factor beta-binding protein 4-like isoform X2 [Mya arenaria]
MELFYFIIMSCFLLNTVLDTGAGEDSLAEPDVPPCKQPHPPANGSVQVWGQGYLLEYSCDVGLVPVGPTFASCNQQTKRWSVGRPVCVAKGCPDPEPLSNGRLYFDHGGTVVIATCLPGYRMTGSRVNYCDGFRWQGFSIRCRARFPPRAGRRQAYETDNSTTTPSPDSNLAKHVLDADNTCYLRFTEPPKVANANVKIEYRFNPVRKQWILLANFTCDKGYRLVDQHTSYYYCKDYAWVAEEAPMCEPDTEAVEPCKINNGGCSHICVDHSGGRYHCECPRGYALGRMLARCFDINECKLDNGGCNQTCSNTEGSFLCSCEPGYVASGQDCLDVDECRSDFHDHCIGTCVNVRGSYRCDCSNVPGYQDSSDQKYCVDTNECLQENGGCTSVCVNTVGSFKCKCSKKGYTLDTNGKDCVDVNECLRYSKTKCRHGVCENLDDGYRCICDAGFRSTASGRKCVDVDECKEHTGGCNQVCVNVPGDFYCSCNAGFDIGKDNLTCEDINECGIGNGGCEDVCINTAGSYLCECSMGMKVISEDRHSCVFCDEKKFYDSATSACVPCPPHSVVDDSSNATSVSHCHCIDGFEKQQGFCDDVDECIQDKLQCNHLCHNTHGSAYCSCHSGYLLENQTRCVDIDECFEERSFCEQNCTNSDGSFSCACMQGYSLSADGRECIDIDECFEDDIECEQLCINTPGGAHCECTKGYTLSNDNQTCNDNDECEAGTHVCADVCINTPGSYSCECQDYGLKLSWDLASCSDINECMEGENSCSSQCINTYGSYTCGCDSPGYRLSSDQSACEDINECEDPSTNKCDDICVNVPGSYHCTCNLGHALVSFNRCDECSRNSYRDDTEIECRACPTGFYTEQRGSTSIDDCKKV